MKRNILFAGIIVLICVLGWGIFWYSVYQSEGRSQKIVTIAGHAVHVSVADTPVLREKGLSGREQLAGDEGMLFIFPTEGKYSFWMKDMNFPLDIVWISADGRIVDMWQHAIPESFPLAFTPKIVAMYVIELPADFATRNNVRIGDLVSI